MYVIAPAIILDGRCDSNDPIPVRVSLVGQAGGQRGPKQAHAIKHDLGAADDR
ncbi:hypothetical protein D1872_156570 [compost metagenome]